MHVVITIDFGMTGSAAEWFDIPSNDKHPRVKGGQIGKIPTQLVYGEKEGVIAWGSASQNSGTVRDCFKIAFPIRKANGQDPDLDVEKWISDYLHHFCNHVLEEIVRVEKTAKEQIDAEWHLTSPGSWNKATQRDFKMLAYKVLLNLLPSSKVILELTEALTSCKFLTNEFKFLPEAWVITCDIGGATIDAALVIDQEEEVFPIIPKTPAQLTSVHAIDYSFRKLLRGFSIEQHRVNEVSKCVAWREARHSFDASKEVVLRVDRHLGYNTPPNNELSIDGDTIKISKEVMQACFESFLSSLWLVIDETIRMLKEKLRGQMLLPGIIALCGGGGTMVYVIDQLKLRYSELEVRAPLSPDRSCLATIIGHRLYLLQLATKNYLKEVEIGMSTTPRSTSTSEILWQNASRVTSWTFSSKTKTTVRYFVVHKRDFTYRPISAEFLKRNPTMFPTTSIWALHISLDNSTHWWREQTYCIEVVCNGIGNFDFNAWNVRNKGITLKLYSTRLK